MTSRSFTAHLPASMLTPVALTPVALTPVALALVALMALAACGCDGNAGNGAAGGGPSSAASGTSVAASPASDAAARVDALLKIELTRDVGAISEDDMRHRDVRVRRQAARALARARDESARALLLRGLVDEDDEVVAWCAYGLGDICNGRRTPTVSALVTAAAAHAGRDGGAPGRIDAMRAITRAVGRCAAQESERTLVNWARLRGPYMLDAIYAIGDLARTRKRLREDSYVALLELAEGNASLPPVAEALYPISRVENLTPSVIERTREVAMARLDKPSPGRAFAVRALGRTDDAAVPLLKQVLADPKTYNGAERVEAARALTRFGRAGQDALRQALEGLVPDTDPLAATGLVSPDVVAPLLSALEGLTDTRRAKGLLEKLARLPAPPDAPAAITRRLSWIRCSAAKLLAERDFKHPDLRACDLAVPEADRAKDPIASSIGARAVVEAIGVDAVKITGARLDAWRSYAGEGEIRAREAALAQLNEHFEIRESAEILAKALDAKEPGIVASAAEVIAAHPVRAMKRAAQPKKGDSQAAPAAATLHEALVAGLVARLDGAGASEDLEALAAVIDASGTLGLAQAKQPLVKLCSSPYPSLRQHSEKALAKIMGKASPRCSAGSKREPPAELDRLIAGPRTIHFDSDIGELSITVDPSLAPVAATRAVELAKNGFYDGMLVHRVVPGFVSQFGSPTFDGYGGVSGLPPLPCETSPVPYAAFSVGVALAGRDTGSSQLFVTHAPTPHLDGEYALVGQAKGAWDALVDGDVLTKAKVSE